MALRRRVLQAARSDQRGVTLEMAAQVSQQPLEVVDGLLTDLARRGTLDMDIDDEGTIHYRVADDLEQYDEDDEQLLERPR